METIKINTIENIIKNCKDDIFSRKKYILDEYEKLECVRVCDTAFPIGIYNILKEYFNLPENESHYFGDWCFAYGDINKFGLLLPCCETSLFILKTMLKSNKDQYLFNKNSFKIEEV